MIELSDSSGSARHRPSQPSTADGPRPGALPNNDLIVISSDSEEDGLLAARLTQRRNTGPGGTHGKGMNRKVAPPPVDAEVISISDSDEYLDTRSGASRRSTVSAAPASTSRVTSALFSSQGAPAPAPRPATVAAPATPPAPISEPTPASTSTQLPDCQPSRPQETQQQNNELPSQPSSSPSYGPSPDDFDDPFDNMDFDTIGNDADPSGVLDAWDSLDVGSSLETFPVALSSGSAGAGADASTTTSEPERACDVSRPDALFDSYVNMDQLGDDMDRETSKGALPGGGGDGAEVRAVENRVTGVLTRESSSGSGRGESPNVDGDGDGDGDGDLRIHGLEEGEVDPNEALAPSTRTPETPESGEIRSQELGREARKDSQPPSSIAPPGVSSQPVVPRLGPTPTLAQLTSSVSASPGPTSSKSASQPFERAGTLVMPDISSYKGVRFKRPLPQARENSFFSRALNSVARSGQAPVSVGERSGEKEGEGSSSGGVSTPAEVPTGVGEVQNKDGDTEVEGDTAVPMPEPLMALPEAVVPTPSPLPQQPAEVPMVPGTLNTTFTELARPSTVESNTTANDSVPASTQPTTSTTQVTSSQPHAATQPLARSSSRPFIAPARVPRPNEPMSLVEALNEVRRERLQLLKEERELARKRSMVDLTGASSDYTVLSFPSSLMYVCSPARRAFRER